MRIIIGLLVAFLLTTPANAADRDRKYINLMGCASAEGYQAAITGKPYNEDRLYAEDGCLDYLEALRDARVAFGGFDKDTASYAAIGTAMGAYDSAYFLTRKLMKEGRLKGSLR